MKIDNELRLVKVATNFVPITILDTIKYTSSFGLWKTCGVYCIKNNINSKIYVGSSINVYKRFLRHLNDLRRGIHNNNHLQQSFLKYGEHNFYICILDYCTKDNVVFKEQFYMDLLNSTDISFGYNIELRADHTLKSEETKQRMRLARIGKKLSNETRKKLSEIRKGKPSWRKGCKLTEEHKQKIRDNAKTNPNYGNTGNKHTEETLKKISQSSTGRHKSEESKAKQSAAIKGRKYSIDHRYKISQANYRRWAKIKEDNLKKEVTVL
jgi:group I intron endonuclease